MTLQDYVRKVALSCVLVGAPMLGAVPASAGVPDDAARQRSVCHQGERGRLLRVELVASFPTAADARARFYE